MTAPVAAPSRELADLLQGWAELDAAAPRYVQAREFDEGTVAEVFASERVRAAIGRSGEAYRFRLLHSVVNAVADRVRIRAVTAPDEQAVADIEQTTRENLLRVLYASAVREACRYGDSYLLTWPRPDEHDGSLDQLRAEHGDAVGEPAERVGVYLHSPLHVRAVYADGDPTRKRYVIKRWEVGSGEGQRWRADLYYPGEIRRWVTTTAGQPTRDTWIPYVDPDDEHDDGAVENPFGVIPWWHLRSGLPYGAPVHEPGYGAQLALSKMLITQVNTSDRAALADRWVLSDPARALDDQQAGPLWDDEQAEKPAPSGPTGPGSMLDLKGDQVGEFSTPPPSVFLEPAEFYIRLMSEQTGARFRLFDGPDANTSGKARIIEDGPAARRAETLQELVASELAGMWRFILAVHEHPVEELTVEWAPAHTATTSDDWAIVKAKQDAGVPRDQALVEAGYPAEQVAEWTAAEGEGLDLGRRIALLQELGDAVTKLGSGVALGVLGQDQATAVIARVLGETADFGEGAG